jgi:hypothetical protein
VEIISENIANFQNGRLRTIHLAYARNRVLQRLRELDKETRIDYVLILDMDNVNLNLKGLETCHTDLPVSWGACCANPYRAYYDLWALRSSPHKNLTVSTVTRLTESNYQEWLQCDVMVDCSSNWERAFRHIPANYKPLKVHSCFGGAALYDVTYLRHPGATYSGKYTKEYGEFYYGKETCEHYIFHQNIHDLFPNFTMYIQPKMLNDGGQEHVRKLHAHEEHAILTSHNNSALQSFYTTPDTN